MTQPEFTVGDTAPDLTGSINADLTGAVARLHIRRPDRTVLNVPVTLTSNADGAWSYTWQPGDLTTHGRYDVEVEVTYADGTVQTFTRDPQQQMASFYVRDQIA